MLGEAGAIVYCSGRSSRTQANTSDHVHAGRPETIEETAALVSAAGGLGIPVRVGWIWPHVATCWHAAPLMVKRKSGLMVEIIEQNGIAYHGQFFFDLMEISLKRLSYAIAQELAPKGVTALAITPGFMRTEAILQGFGVTEANWREAAEHNAEAKAWGFISSETPCFVGRAVAALAADPHVARKSGGIYDSWSLSEEYGFTDLDGTRPNMGRYLSEHHPQLVNRKPPTAFEWKLVAASRSVTS